MAPTDADQAEVEIRGVARRDDGGTSLDARPVVTTQEDGHGFLSGSTRQSVPVRQHITVRPLGRGADGEDHARGAADSAAPLLHDDLCRRGQDLRQRAFAGGRPERRDRPAGPKREQAHRETERDA